MNNRFLYIFFVLIISCVFLVGTVYSKTETAEGEAFAIAIGIIFGIILVILLIGIIYAIFPLIVGGAIIGLGRWLAKTVHPVLGAFVIIIGIIVVIVMYANGGGGTGGSHISGWFKPDK